MFSSFKSLPHPYFRFLRWFLRVEELCLVVDPYAKERGEGRYGFVDFFISSSPGSYGSPVALIELKQVSQWLIVHSKRRPFIRGDGNASQQAEGREGGGPTASEVILLLQQDRRRMAPVIDLRP